MKRLLPLLAASALLILPSAALADTLTFTSPVTASNNTPVTNGSSSDPNSPNYVGGVNQFDLDHHNAYTWQINNINLGGKSIVSATITFKNIANWDTTTNRLFVHLLNTAIANGNNQVASVVDATGSPVTTISDYFDGSNNALALGGANDIKLTEQSFNMVGQGGYVATNFVYTFTGAQLSSLASFISTGSNIAFGFDPDCHYWNNGITFTIVTAPSVPEPATMLLLGTGLSFTGMYLRRRRQQK